jgi:hypothetical protein
MLSLPDRAYFTGTVAGESDSLVFLAAGRDRVHGFVASGGDVHPFGPDGHGGHRIYSVRDVDPTVYPPPGDFCANDLYPEQVALPAAVAALAEPAPPIAATTTLKQADVAIETDYELRAKFATDTDALNYLSSLAAAGDRDLRARRRGPAEFLLHPPLGDVGRSLDATSPQRQRSTSCAPTGTTRRTTWRRSPVPRTTVHFISGKSVQGGVAYVNVLCNASYGLRRLAGVRRVRPVAAVADLGRRGSSRTSSATTSARPTATATRRRSTSAYNQEAGCYSGPVVASRGTIMSYCHLLAGGLANIDLCLRQRRERPHRPERRRGHLPRDGRDDDHHDDRTDDDHQHGDDVDQHDDTVTTSTSTTSTSTSTLATSTSTTTTSPRPLPRTTRRSRPRRDDVDEHDDVHRDDVEHVDEHHVVHLDRHDVDPDVHVHDSPSRRRRARRRPR